MTGAECLVRELQARGVEFLAVLSGNGLDPLLAAAAGAGLRIVDTRNEQAASYIADAYARLTGRVGVCAVSSGIAHVNALAGVLNAWYDGAPVLLISGASASDAMGRGNFQDLDQVALAQSICKRAELVTRAGRIPQAVQESFAAATSGRPGPVHLTITIDALTALTDTPRALRDDAAENGTWRAPADKGSIREAARLLAEARRPIIVAGTGLFYGGDGRRALQTLSQLARVPVVTPIWDRGVVDAPSDTFLGVVGAASGEPDLLSRADLILLAGARVDYRLRYLDSPPLARDLCVVRIDADPTALGQGLDPQLAMAADPGLALGQLLEAWRRGRCAGHQDWLAEARSLHDAFYGRWATPQPQPSGCMTGGQLAHALRPLLDEGGSEAPIFLVDGGNIGQWAHMVLCRDRYPAHWLTCGASAVVGWGVAGAMAARLAAPTLGKADRSVLLLSGDGALGFGLMEFESAARQGIPFVTVVADDRAWGIVVSGQLKAGHRAVGCELGEADYAGVARALGGEGLVVDDPAELAPAVRRAFASGRPTLIQVPVARGGPAD